MGPPLIANVMQQHIHTKTAAGGQTGKFQFLGTGMDPLAVDQTDTNRRDPQGHGDVAVGGAGVTVRLQTGDSADAVTQAVQKRKLLRFLHITAGALADPFDFNRNAHGPVGFHNLMKHGSMQIMCLLG